MGHVCNRPSRPVERVFVHCSASDVPAHDDVKVIQQWHKQRWPDLCATEAGYHFFIKKDGTIQPSRSLEKKPVAQAGHNSHTIAICLHGLKVAKFTEQQKAALRSLCQEIFDAYDGNITFHGHREVAAKDCPVIDYKAWLGLDRMGRLHGRSPTKPVATPMPTLKVGSRGGMVMELQSLLGFTGSQVDGKFGGATERAVMAFQRKAGLVDDGIVGRNTWKALQTEGGA